MISQEHNRRTVIVVTGGFPAVSQTFVLREIAAMRCLGWKVHVVASQVGTCADWEQAEEFGIGRDNVTVLNWRKCFPSIPFLRNNSGKDDRIAERRHYGRILSWKRRRYFQLLQRRLGPLKSDLVHCHFLQWADEVGIGLAQMLKCPMTAVIHDSHFPQYDDATLSRVQQSAAAIACVNREWMEIWKDRCGTDHKLHWVPNGVELNEFVQNGIKRTQISPVTILSVGTCEAKKRHSDLLMAAKQLASRGLHFRLIIIGGGPLENALRQRSHALGLQQFVEFLGAQPHSVVRRRLSEADIFVLCSERESFGIVTTEAMSSGLPVIVSRTAGAKDVVEDGVTGYLFDIGDVVTLSELISKMINDPAMRKRFGAAGRLRVEKHFTWERHMQLMHDLWEDAICTKRLQSLNDTHAS